MCEQLLANPLIESYEVEIVPSAAAGSASSRTPARRTTGTRSGRSPRSARRRWRSGTRRATSPASTPSSCPAASRTATTSAAARSPASPRRRPRSCEFAEAGGFVLGICNGFQILCEAGLLPGALLRNESLRFVCRDVPLRVERNDLPFTSRCTPRQRLVHPGQARRRPLRPAARTSTRRRSCSAISTTRTARSTRSPASATRRETSWGSCRTRSTPSTRCSAPTTARSSSRRSSTPRATARSFAAIA